MLKVWKTYAYSLKKAGKESFYAMMINEEPTLTSPLDIHFEITNKIQKEGLERIKSDLLSTIRKELNNWSIQFTYDVKASTTEVKENLYASKDRFKKMTEKNPALLKMQKLFSLDIDF